jgi:hypothetical protein
MNKELEGVRIDGFVRFNITVRLNAAELASWSPARIAAFFEGVARIVLARGDETGIAEP